MQSFKKYFTDKNYLISFFGGLILLMYQSGSAIFHQRLCDSFR